MKTPKILLLAAASAALAAGAIAQAPSQAGPQSNPPVKSERGEHFKKRLRFHRMHHRAGRHLMSALSLTDAQKEQIKAIRLDSRKNIRALIQNDGVAKEAKREQVKQIRDHAKDQVANVLTPDQRAQLEQMKETAKKRFQNRRDNRGQRGTGKQIPPTS